MRLSIALGCLILPALGCGGEQPAAVLSPTVVRFITGISGGSFRAIGDALHPAFQSLEPGLHVERLPGMGAVGNVEAVEDGRADLGLAFADVVYLAAGGQLPQRPLEFEHLAGVAVLQLTPLQVLVSRHEKASNVAQLRRRIGVAGNIATGTAITAQLVLGMLAPDIPPSEISVAEPDAVPARLESGNLQAYLQLGSAPMERVQAAMDRGARHLPLTPPQVRQLLAAYPFFKPAQVTGRQYRGLAASIETIGVDSVLFCRKELPEAVVHDLIKVLFEARVALTARFGPDFLGIESAPTTSIPLHPGAARFYRERELSR